MHRYARGLTHGIQPAHDAFRDRYRTLRHQDDAHFREAINEGILHPAVDPHTIGQLTSAVMDGLQLQWLLDPEGVDMVALFDQFLALLAVHPTDAHSADAHPPTNE